MDSKNSIEQRNWETALHFHAKFSKMLESMKEPKAEVLKNTTCWTSNGFKVRLTNLKQSTHNWNKVLLKLKSCATVQSSIQDTCLGSHRSKRSCLTKEIRWHTKCRKSKKTNLNDWLKSTVEPGKTYTVRKHLECNDGTTLSVQASQVHYCNPRKDCYFDGVTFEFYDYTSVEVWGVSVEPPESWKEYGNQEDDPYAYIPVGMVEDFIDQHGGIKQV